MHDKPPNGKVAIESLYHFNCGICKKWWTIGDAHLNTSNLWYCPWCGTKQLLEETPNSRIATSK